MLESYSLRAGFQTEWSFGYPLRKQQKNGKGNEKMAASEEKPVKPTKGKGEEVETVDSRGFILGSARKNMA